MSIAPATIAIAPLRVPTALDADDAGDFLLLAELTRRICDLDAGIPDLAPSAAELLPPWQDSTDAVDLGFVARRDDEVVGMVTLSFAQEEGSRVAEFDLLVLPEHAGTGVEEALLAVVDEEARNRGRTSLQTWTLHRPLTAEQREDGSALIPATGWGRVSRSRLSTLLDAAGFRLEQVERNSEFDLRSDPAPLQALLDEALAAAGPDYRAVRWILPTPPEHRDGYAAILARLSTDAPHGELEIVAEEWDESRLTRRETRLAEAGRLMSVAAVVHEPTGTIAAYNELVIGADRAELTHQFGTLVHADHRGHRLGTIVKCVNLLAWPGIAPQSPAVSTFNAEENRPMLDINERIGFTAVSYAAAWQKTLPVT